MVNGKWKMANGEWSSLCTSHAKHLNEPSGFLQRVRRFPYDFYGKNGAWKRVIFIGASLESVSEKYSLIFPLGM